MATGIPTYEQFRRSLAGTPMVGEAKGIYDAALAGGVNPAFVSGLASAESGYGTRGYAVGKNNPYGLGVHLGWRFKNYTEATKKLTRTLNSLNYPQRYKQGGISKVIEQYTPYGDANNDPMAHTRNIISAGRRTGGNPALVYTKGGAVPMAPLSPPGGGGGGAMPSNIPPSAPQSQRPGVSVSNELRRALISQYAMSAEGTLTPDVARKNTLMLARLAGAGFASSMRPQPEVAATPFSSAPSGSGGGGGTGGPSINVPNAPGQLSYGSTRGVVRPLPTALGTSDYGGGGDREGQGGRHLGDDWFAPANTPVAAPVSGTVFRVRNDPNPGQRATGQVYGGSTYIRDDSGRVWVFRHLETPEKYVQSGKRVRAGQNIGLVKSWTGSPHSHIELYSPGPYEYSAKRALNPHDFFRRAGIR